MSYYITECRTIPRIVYSLDNETKVCLLKIEYTFSYSNKNYANKQK